ncbi:hypothetical protein [Algisphaera agarilytica]|uniref:FlgO domain-containing protein n=1 Tax=Algisphaera agarilytica TaxID=1385975 RepID=A0A7X0H7K9_9BACT|nr:hypothetical protein [Algisphaera agarilytica]MBB6430767.1 hypothetical protein [Algisphaera agarilytica]
MTSKQIVLILLSAVLLSASLSLSGCKKPQRMETIKAPYPTRQVFAVAPFRNESGSAYADGARMADKVTQRLALVRGIDTLPVNRVYSAMDALGINRIADKGDAIRLRQTLGVDGLVVGTITAYEPYNPPKLGLNLELYLDARLAWQGSELDTRELSAAATDNTAVLPGGEASRRQPVTALGGFYDAADPNVIDLLEAYLAERRPDDSLDMALRRHTLSIDLYSEFVSTQVTSQLLQAERLRLRRPTASNTQRPDPNVPAPQSRTPEKPAFVHPTASKGSNN